MDLTPYIRSLREDLLAAAAIGDEEIRRAASVLAAAIEPSARLAMMNALSDLAAEVTGLLEGITVDLRLDGRDVKVNVAEHDRPEAPADTGAGQRADSGRAVDRDDLDPRIEHLRRAVQDAGGELSRTTVRLFNDLKSQAEQAAAGQGISLNTYISRAVSDSVRSAVPPKMKSKHGQGKSGKPGRTVTGFIQA